MYFILALDFLAANKNSYYCKVIQLTLASQSVWLIVFFVEKSRLYLFPIVTYFFLLILAVIMKFLNFLTEFVITYRGLRKKYFCSILNK